MSPRGLTPARDRVVWVVVRVATYAVVAVFAALVVVSTVRGLRPFFSAGRSGFDAADAGAADGAGVAGVTLSAVLGRADWRPISSAGYGIVGIVVTSFLVAVPAVALTLPLCVLAAVGLAARTRRGTPSVGVRWLVKAVRGVMIVAADLPSVVYGYVGLVVVVPALERYAGFATGHSLAAAIIVLVMMIAPTTVLLVTQAIAAVPPGTESAARALGAGEWQVIWRAVVPAVRPQIWGAGVLAVTRALGETFAVVLVAGNSPQLPTALSDPVRTLTTTIALEMGAAGGVHRDVLFTMGLLLMIVVLVLNWVALRVGRRRGEFVNASAERHAP